MADNVTTPLPAGSVFAADDVSGVFYERFKVNVGADGAAADVHAGNGMPTAGAYLEASGSASANNTDLVASTDVRQYRSVVMQLTGTFSLNVQVQVSVDGTTWVYLPMTQAGGTASLTMFSSISATGLYEAPLNAKYLRVRTTSYTSGTATATVMLSAEPMAARILTVNGAATSLTVDTELPTVIALGDANSNPTTPLVGAAGMVYNGSTWERARSPYANAWSANCTTLNNLAIQVKSSAGVYGGHAIYNPNASVAYVQVFNTNGPTVGTTGPTIVFPVPATTSVQMELTVGVAMSTAITVAATTTPTGGTSPTTNLWGQFFYR